MNSFNPKTTDNTVLSVPKMILENYKRKYLWKLLKLTLYLILFDEIHFDCHILKNFLTFSVNE